MRKHLLFLALLTLAACKSEKIVDPPNVTTINLSQAAGFGLVGDSVLFTVKDMPPGTYTFWCEVERHASLGMVGTLTVTP